MQATTNHPSPFGAGLRTLLLPGWGQLATHHRILGWTFVGLSALVVLATAVLVFGLGTDGLLDVLTRPDVLLLLISANVLVGGLRLALTGHAWWAGGGRGLVGLAALVVLVAVPHVAFGWVASSTYDTLTGVFQPSSVAPPPSTTTSATAPGGISTTTTDPPTPGADRVTVLLLGGDAGPGRTGLRTDTMIIATIDSATGHAALFGLPRNYGAVAFSDGTPFPKGPDALLNEVYGWGVANPDAFGGPDPGASAIVDVAGHLTGLSIDHYALVDMAGFAAVVDALGGVQVTVDAPVPAPLYDPTTGGHRMITIPAGDQRLDGDHALAYARSRTGSDDFDRMGRQRCLLAAIAGEVDAVSLVTGINGILRAIEEHVATDIPVDRVGELARAVAGVERIDVVGFGPGWIAGRTTGGVAMPDVGAIRATVFQTLSDPTLAEDLSGVESADGAC